MAPNSSDREIGYGSLSLGRTFEPQAHRLCDSYKSLEAIMTTQAVATVLGGFWPANGVGSLAGMSGESGARRAIRMGLGEYGQLKSQALMFSLVAFGPGSVATKNITRVVASPELGGVRAIETVSIINRTTVSADFAEIQQDYLTSYTKNTFGANPPANLDRNPLGTR
jgi:hypothetical protein